MTTPEPQTAALAESTADRGEIRRLPGQGLRRPRTGGEIHPPRAPWAITVHRVQISPSRQRRRDLARRRRAGSSTNRLNARAQAAEERRDIGDARMTNKISVVRVMSASLAKRRGSGAVWEQCAAGYDRP